MRLRWMACCNHEDDQDSSEPVQTILLYRQTEGEWIGNGVWTNENDYKNRPLVILSLRVF